MPRLRELDLTSAIVPVWSVMLTLAIGAPWLSRGYILSYDMVWVPHLDLARVEVWGLGSGLPRAVPSDAVVALLGSALPAAVVQRLVLCGALFALALGMARLLRERGLVAQLTAATFAVWNPYVAERLALGQWPVIVGLAALPWLIGALRSTDRPRWSLVTALLAATALSPATGLMGLLLALVVQWPARAVRLVFLAALVNAPWIVAGLLHASIARSDPAAVRLFDVQAEGSFGRLGSALTLGGIWNTEVVPTSRTLGLTAAIAVIMGVVMLVGIARLWRDDRQLVTRLGMLAGIGVLVALSGWLAPVVVERIVGQVPGGGVIRDGTRWLALLVPFEAIALGAGAGAIFERARFTAWEYPALVLALVVPIAALPDIAWGVGGRLEPVHYPEAYSDARRVIERSPIPGDILVLPFTSYRAPVWNQQRSVLDPAGRFFDRTTVTNDELTVGDQIIAGEDPRAALLGEILASGDDVPRAVARAGIGLVLVETDAVGAAEAVELFDGVREVQLAGGQLRLLVLDGVQAQAVDPSDRRTMIAGWSAAGITVLWALMCLLRTSAAGLYRKSAKYRARKVAKH